MVSRIFFYGLYMDTGLLENMGLRPTMVGTARLRDYELRIGDRATLVPALGRSSYGVLLDLPAEDARVLYSRPEVADYRPEAVEVTLLSDNSPHAADCYVLPAESLNLEPNTEYARSLAALVARLGIPSEYYREVLRYAGDI